jgi:glycosyltransferase involved in cell wall biosynthesis
MAEITVIIPAHNAAEFIGPTLESVLTQDFTDIELIVVDDGSTDNTLEALEAAATRDRRIVIVSQPNQGVSKARNAGLRSASSTTNALMFLDHDDILLPRSLARLSQALISGSGASAAHGEATVIDADGNPIEAVDPNALGLVRRRLSDDRSLVSAAGTRTIELESGEATTFAALVYTSCITSPGQVLIRSSAIRQIGGFDPATAPSDDWDLYLRLSRLGPLAYLPEPVLGWRKHEFNASRDKARMKRSSYAVRRKLVDRSSRLNSAELAIVRRQFAYTAAALVASVSKRDPATDLRSDLIPALKLFVRAILARPAK